MNALEAVKIASGGALMSLYNQNRHKCHKSVTSYLLEPQRVKRACDGCDGCDGFILYLKRLLEFGKKR